MKKSIILTCILFITLIELFFDLLQNILQILRHVININIVREIVKDKTYRTKNNFMDESAVENKACLISVTIGVVARRVAFWSVGRTESLSLVSGGDVLHLAKTGDCGAIKIDGQESFVTRDDLARCRTSCSSGPVPRLLGKIAVVLERVIAVFSGSSRGLLLAARR